MDIAAPKQSIAVFIIHLLWEFGKRLPPGVLTLGGEEKAGGAFEKCRNQMAFFK
jgi:hypothetical protein